MKKRVNRKPKYILFYIMVIVVVIFSNIFSNDLEILFKLKPNIYITKSTQVHFIDVGQGDAIAVKLSNGKTMLIDSGITDYRKKLTTYLDKVVLDNKIIDYLILTHPDVDHSGNIKYILENFDVKNFYRPEIYHVSENKIPFCDNSTYGEILETLKNLDINVYFNTEQQILDDDMSITWLTILDQYEDVSKLDTNQFSPILIVEDNGVKLMLTGDINTKSEALFIDKYGEDVLDVDILKLSHHGSKNSNSMEFLEITSPRYVVTSVGENTYGHPAYDVLVRLLEYDKIHNTKLYDNFKATLYDGNIVYTLESNIIINEIDNIDNYGFVDYWVYSTAFLIIIVYFYIKPYFYVWKRNIRFYIQNRKYVKLKEQEKLKQIAQKGKNSTK